MEYGDNTFGNSVPVDLSAIEAENKSSEENTESTAVEETETTPETDNVETNEIEQQEVAEIETQEEEKPLILGKFKTVADLEKAYRNLEAYNTKLAQQAKAAPKVEQQQKQVDDEAAKDQQMVDWYEREVQVNPIGANAALARYMAQKEIDKYKAEMDNTIQTQLSPIVQERQNAQALKAFKSKYPDADTYADAMDTEAVELLEEYPDIASNPKLFYETLYSRAKARTLEEKSKQAFDNGKKIAQEELKKKKSIHNETKATNNDDDTLPAGINILRRDEYFF